MVCTTITRAFNRYYGLYNCERWSFGPSLSELDRMRSICIVKSNIGIVFNTVLQTSCQIQLISAKRPGIIVPYKCFLCIRNNHDAYIVTTTVVVTIVTRSHEKRVRIGCRRHSRKTFMLNNVIAFRWDLKSANSTESLTKQ